MLSGDSMRVKRPIPIDSAGNSVRSGCSYSLRYAIGENHHFKTVHVFYDEAGQFVCRDTAKTVANGFQLVRDQPADAIWDFVDGHKVRVN